MSWFFDEVINSWMQAVAPWLKWPFIIITYLGDALIYIILLAIAYWVYNRKEAIIGMYVLLTSTFLNFFLKVLIQKPRPDVSVRLIEAEGFSTPSGHAQTSTVIYGWIMLHFKKIWLYILVPILVLFICISRVYLGVHFIGDVIIGFFIGLIILVGLFFLIPLIINWLEKVPNKIKILLGECYALIVFISTFIPGLYAAWPLNEAENSADLVAALVILPMAIWVECNWIKLKNENILWYSKLLRVLIGLICVIGIFIGIDELFELIITNYYAVQYLIDFTKYAVIIATIALLMPLLFSRVKLFSKEKIILRKKRSYVKRSKQKTVIN